MKKSAVHNALRRIVLFWLISSLFFYSIIGFDGYYFPKNQPLLHLSFLVYFCFQMLYTLYEYAVRNQKLSSTVRVTALIGIFLLEFQAMGNIGDYFLRGIRH